jgi:Flp pilus assembly protein TadG
MVEFAILLPFLVLLLTIVLDFCRVFYHYTIVTNCARNAALYASDQTAAKESPYTVADRATSIRNAALADAGDIPLAEQPKIVVTSTAVSVTVSYPVPMVTSYLGMTSKTVGRTVYMNAAPESPNF